MSRVVHYNIYPRTLKCSAVAKSYVTLAEFHKMKGRLYNNLLTENGSPQAKKLVAYACKPVVVKSYPPALFLYIAQNPYTDFCVSKTVPAQTKYTKYALERLGKK